MFRFISGAVRALRATSSESLCMTMRCAFATSTTTRLVKKLEKKINDRILNVTWDDGTSSRYPFVYLRDICQCPECFHDSSKQRAFDSVAGLSNDLVATEANVMMNGKNITLTWPNDHVSSFDADWLFSRRLPEEEDLQQEKMNGLVNDNTHLWDHKMTGNVPELSFQEVLNDKSSQIKWLDFIHGYGITLIKDAPKEPGQVQKLGDVLGFLKEMWFGKAQQTTNNYDCQKQMDAVIPQSSSPYHEYRGGLHLIHCQQQAQGPGGEHMFVDGFKIAKHLQDIDPETFHLLCTSPIIYQLNAGYQNTKLNMKFTHPVIRLDSNNQIKNMIYSNTTRLSFSHATPDNIPKLYQAFFKLTELIKDPKYAVKYKLQSGDIISYDCDRVLSGRNAFGPKITGTEIFEDAFSDKDMTLSRRRTLNNFKM